MPHHHADFGNGCVKRSQSRLMWTQNEFNQPVRSIISEGGCVSNVEQPFIAVLDGYPAMAVCMSI